MNDALTGTIQVASRTETLPIEYGDTIIIIGDRLFSSRMWKYSVNRDGVVTRVYLESELKRVFGSEIDKGQALNFNAENFLTFRLKEMIYE